MNTPAPLPNPLTPSNSVLTGIGVGLPVVVVLSWIADAFFHITVPPEVGAALGTLIGGAIAYFADGGKAIHTA